MLFDLLHWKKWLVTFALDKEQDTGTEDSTGEDAEKKKDDKAAEDQNAGEKKEDKPKPKEEEKVFTQAQLEAIMSDRLERERKKAQAEADKARKKAEADALVKNQEWQTLAEQRQTEIEAITKEKEELEPFKESSNRYKKALEAQLAKRKEKLPEHISILIEKMDPVDALQYLTDHAEALGAKPETYGETPKGKERQVTEEDKQSAQRAAQSLISRSF